MTNTAVAMSGGVDSSVVAALLSADHHAVLGITMLLTPSGQDAVLRAEKVCHQLGLAHLVTDLQEEFAKQVQDSFVTAYEAGLTPNPCVTCNKTIKFGALLDIAAERGCTHLATGHYANIAFDRGSGRYLLQRAVDPKKDQSYFLALLSQRQLKSALFPLGNLTKEDIRALAAQQNLVTAKEKDSQDICFIPDGDHAGFIRQYTGKPYPCGAFLSPEGAVLGTHQGIIAYTEGQRRGLGVSSNQGRLYVVRKNAAENTVTLGQNERLFSKTLYAKNPNFIALSNLSKPITLDACIRSRHMPVPATVEQVDSDTLRVCFQTAQRAAAPGQLIAFYDGNTVVAGATIYKVEE